MPSQKFGVRDAPQREHVGAVVPGRALLHRRDDAGGDADQRARSTIAIEASWSVTGSFSRDQLAHRLLVAQRLAEVARQHALDPVDVLHRQRLDRAGTACGSARSPRVALLARHDQRRDRRAAAAAAPKISIDTKISVGMSCDQPLGEEVQHGSFGAGVLTSASGRCTRTRPSGICLQPSSLVGVRDSHAAVVEIDDRAVLEHDLGRASRRSPCAGRVAHRARASLSALSTSGVGNSRRCSAARCMCMEDVGVAVGIGAAAPADQVGLELAASACLSEVANSVTRIFRSKPASPPSPARTCATACASRRRSAPSGRR